MNDATRIDVGEERQAEVPAAGGWMFCPTREAPGRRKATDPRGVAAGGAALLWTLAAAVLALSATALAGQPVAELSLDEEVRLALSAGPPAVARQAEVWILGERGLEKAIDGSNGYACMVIRSAADPELLAPHCFSPDAVETVVPAKVAESRMQVRGMGAEEIDAALRRAMEDGELPLPSGDAFAYMLSSGQRLGPAGRWRPHFMIYMPYATNEMVGGSPEMPAFPFVGPEVGHPHSTLVIVMTEFVDPTDVPRRR